MSKNDWACEECLRRTWLLSRLCGHLAQHPSKLDLLLTLSDSVLISAIGGRLAPAIQAEYDAYGTVQATQQRRRAEAVGLGLICCCDPSYPRRLRQLSAPPAVLHVAGRMERMLELADADGLAIVGSRRASEYGRDVAHDLARGVSAAGVTVISGLATGIDAAAHRGALDGGGRTIAVLPGAAHEPTPAANRGLHGRIITEGVAISEFGSDCVVRNWSHLARNRIVAGLADAVVIVQGTADSGSLRTVEQAQSLGRPIGAVPGQVNNRMSEAPHRLLAGRRAALIGGAQDALELIARATGTPSRAAAAHPGPPLNPRERELLDAITAGHDTVEGLTRIFTESPSVVAEITALELDGLVRRGAGGRLSVIRWIPASADGAVGTIGL